MTLPPGQTCCLVRCKHTALGASSHTRLSMQAKYQPMILILTAVFCLHERVAAQNYPPGNRVRRDTVVCDGIQSSSARLAAYNPLITFVSAPGVKRRSIG